MFGADKTLIVGIILLISITLGFFGVGLWSGSIFPYTSDDLYLHSITIGGTPVKVEIAATPDAQAKGLSGRASLPYSRGMLFVFSTPAPYRIWMKNMLMPIDVFWIDANGTVIMMWEEAHPDSYPEARGPKDDAAYVLETTAGFARVYNIKVGDEVTGL